VDRRDPRQFLFLLFRRPGEHHICASWQARVLLGQPIPTAAAHFEAAAGTVYYFRVKNKGGPYSAAGISLEPLDSDEFKLLASTYSFSASQEKKASRDRKEALPRTQN
jgi:hypothetical protein